MSSRLIASWGQHLFNFQKDSQVTGHGEGSKAKNEAEARAPSTALPTEEGEKVGSGRDRAD